MQLKTLPWVIGVLLLVCITPAPTSAQPAPSCPTPTFGASVPTTLASATGGGDVVLADFNGDSAADAAISGGFALNVVRVLLGSGDGRLLPAPADVSVATPLELATGDFDGDTRTDLVVVSGAPAPTVKVLRGLGDGTFGPPLTLAVSNLPRDLATGDFTGDGRMDVVAVENTPGTVVLFEGDGAGGFGPGANFPVGASVRAVATGDFNGDARSDLAVAVVTASGAGAVRLLFGTPDGFTGPSGIPIGEEVSELAAGDFDGDGDVDLALVIAFEGIVSTLRNDGAGGFAGGGVATIVDAGATITTGDFNGDGLADLAVGRTATERFPDDPDEATAPLGMVDVLYGNSSGGFAGARSFVAGQHVQALRAGDGNGDGRLDLVAVTEGWNSAGYRAALVLLNTCGAVADATVTVADFADPVHHLDLGYSVTVANTGPDAAPVMLRMRITHFLTFNEVTTTHGTCHPGTNPDAAVAGVLQCWFGILEAGETAHLTLHLESNSTPDVLIATARVASGGEDPDLSNNQDVETTRVMVTGGRGLLLSHPPGGPVLLRWHGGDFQAGYFIARFVDGAMTVLPADGTALPRDATSFVDALPVAGKVNCYAVTAVDASGAPVGRSEMVCVKPGSASGQAPTDMTIALNGSTVNLYWTGPGSQSGYMLIAHSLQTGAQTHIPLSIAVTFRHNTAGAPFCYVLIPGNGTTPIGASDLFCAFPGFSDLDR